MNKFSATLSLEAPLGTITFGKYPTNDELNIIKQAGYTVIVDLCPADEVTWEPYPRDGLEYHHHPIKDRTPVNKAKINEFRELIELLSVRVKENKRIYVHCRGGHGRSGFLAAILLGRVTGMSAEECLLRVREAHQQRIEMKPQWRKLGAPQTAAQKKFVVSELNK